MMRTAIKLFSSCEISDKPSLKLASPVASASFLPSDLVPLNDGVDRAKDVIITGGENVFPVEVESAIRSTNLVTDVSVIGVPDPEWGEAITAVYVPYAPEVSPADLSAAIENQLTRYKQPKFWLPVENLPRNERGKVNRQQIEQIARSSLGRVIS